MKVWSVILAGLVFCSVNALGQEPAHPGQALSSDLIAWSYLQEPQQPEPHQQTVPEPSPETQPATNPATTQPSDHRASPSSQESTQAPIAQIFTGIVSKEADTYVLRVSDSTSYKLDSEQQVQPYEGKRVKITGTLDRALNLIHVDKVESMS